jgi:hypothetical protein
MNELTIVCTDALVGITSYDCVGVTGNRVNKLLIAKEDHGLTVSGDVPTVSEFQAGMAATGDAKVVVVGHISNGLIDEVSATELTDLDTEHGLTERENILMGITGNIKRPTSSVIEQTMRYNAYTVLKVWVIDNKGNCWGGKTGYKCAGRNAFSPKKMDGVTTHISFNLNYISDNVDDDYAQDDDYLTLDNS